MNCCIDPTSGGASSKNRDHHHDDDDDHQQYEEGDFATATASSDCEEANQHHAHNQEVEFGKEKQLARSGRPHGSLSPIHKIILWIALFIIFVAALVGLAVGLTRNKKANTQLGDSLGSLESSEQGGQSSGSSGGGGGSGSGSGSGGSSNAVTFMAERCDLIDEDDQDVDPLQACLVNPWEPGTYDCCDEECCSVAFKTCVDNYVCGDDEADCPPGEGCLEFGNDCIDYLETFDVNQWDRLWDISGSVSGDYTGSVVALSADGSTMAVLAERNYLDTDAITVVDEDETDYYVYETTLLLRVYRFDCSSWNQIGDDISLEGNYHELDRLIQRKMVLSDNGNVLAVGTGLFDVADGNEGRVYVFDYEGSSWVSRPTIDGENAGDQEGAAIALSNDGNIIAVSTFIASSGSGRVRVLRYQNGQWERVGSQSIVGTEADALFGYAIDLSSDGTTLAVAAPWTNGGDGVVRLYKLGNDDSGQENWNPIPTPLLPPEGYKHTGISVSLSDNGRILAVGILTSEEVGGAFEVYRLDSNEKLVAMGSTKTSRGWYGSSVSLSGDGLTVAVGRWKKGTADGFADVYRFEKADDSETGGSDWIWERIGWPDEDAIGGSAESHSVAISGDGRVLACGTPFLGDSGSTGHAWVYINGGSLTS